jgi:hypothetical protein
MKTTLLLIPLVLGLGSSAWASTCMSGTLAAYEASSFSCSIGDLTFSDFTYTLIASGGAVAPDATGVAVTPITTGEIGLLFNAAWLANAGQTIDAPISYDVSSPTADITDLTLEMVGTTTLTGSASVAETASNGRNLGVTPAAFTQTVTFAPVDSLSLNKDIAVSGGTTGTGHISYVYNLFSETSPVPEPSLLILCTGLLGLVLIARRKFVR